MKKIFCLLSVILCLSLICCSCSGKKYNDGEELTQTTNKTDKKSNPNRSKLDVLKPAAYGNVEGLSLEPGSRISVIGRHAGDSYWEAVEAGAKQAVADINKMLGYKGDDKIKLIFSAPEHMNNVDEQVSILDEELNANPIAIAIAPVDTSACAIQFDLAAEYSIPIVTFDSGSDYQNIASHISTNNEAAAKTAAEKLAGMIKENGEIAVFVQDSTSMTAKHRLAAFKETIEASYPEVSIVNVYHMDQLEETAKAIAEEKAAAGEEISPESLANEDVVKYVLEKNPNLKGIFATNLDATQLVAKVINNDKYKSLKLVGFDGGEEQTKLLKKKVINGLIVQNPYGMGYAAIVSAARVALGLGNESYVDSSYTWVTKENMSSKEVKAMLY